MRVKYVCRGCGSDRIEREAWATWDTENQEWVLSSVYGPMFCQNCGRDVNQPTELKDGE